MLNELEAEVLAELVLLRDNAENGSTGALVDAVRRMEQSGVSGSRVTRLFETNGSRMVGDLDVAPNFHGWRILAFEHRLRSEGGDYRARLEQWQSSTIEVGLTGQHTAIGDALEITIKHLREWPDGSRVVILLSDGSSNAGTLAPLTAARLAEHLGVRVYTIGVGSEAMVASTRFGPQVVSPSKDQDEDTLRSMAETTVGRRALTLDTAVFERHYLMHVLPMGFALPIRPV